MLKLSGYNYFSQLGEKSNRRSIDNYPSITPPANSQLNASSISSYSLYYDHTVIILEDGTILAIGYNGSGQIYGSLYHDIIEKYTKFDFKDSIGRLWYPKSAVCGYEYTLYMVSSTKESNKTRLALSHYKYGSETELPLFLNIGSLNPVALYGGRFHSAAIDEEGSIIFIPELIFKSPTVLIDSTPLPNNEKAINIACMNKFIVVVSSSGKLYISDIPETKEKIVFNNIDDYGQFDIMNETSQKGDGIIKLKFRQIESLNKIKIVDVSGTFDHCFAISEDGKVYGFGSNENGQLGIGKETDKLNEFTEIKSLNEYKINHAYAGWSHSLFQSDKGKILACGSNLAGELLGNTMNKNPIYLPIETSIDEGATFCIAGKGLSTVFIQSNPLMSPNRRISIERLKAPEKSEKLENEIKILREENERLHEIIKNMKNEPKNEANDQYTIELFDQEAINKMRKIEIIGQGSQSEVYKVATEQSFALKVLHQNMKKTKSKKQSSESNNAFFISLKRLLQEYEIMQALKHPNIAKSFGFCYGDNCNPPSILMQLCPHNLSDIVEDMDNTQRITAIFEICLGMEAVHAANLIHRDLKPENILIDDKGHIRLTDFGISCLVDVEGQTHSMTAGVGTLKFMAPELLNENEHYDNKVDVYSFGVIVFFILTGGDLPKISIIDIGIGKKATIPSSINKISTELINMCWSTKAEERPSFSEIIEFIKSKNFQMIDGIEKEITQIKDFLSI